MLERLPFIDYPSKMRFRNKMANLVDYNSFVDKSKFISEKIYPDDWRRPSPPRARWMDTLRNEDYSNKISAIKVPVLIIYSRNDIQSSEKLNTTIHKKMEE